MRSKDTCRSARNAMHITKLLSLEDRKYNENDCDSYYEFGYQYRAASSDLCLSPSKCQQYLQNLFHCDALRLYNAIVVGRARQFSEALQTIMEQFRSASKQQQATAELFELFYVRNIGRTGGENH